MMLLTFWALGSSLLVFASARIGERFDGCPLLPCFQQDTASTKAGIASFSPPMAEDLAETTFSCSPAEGTNMTIITAFSAFFGGDPIQYISPANYKWELKLKCNKEGGYWFMEELIEDIMWYIKFYKIRCNSFLLADVGDIDRIGEELKNTPFP